MTTRRERMLAWLAALLLAWLPLAAGAQTLEDLSVSVQGGQVVARLGFNANVRFLQQSPPGGTADLYRVTFELVSGDESVINQSTAEARELVRQGIDPRSSSLKVGIFGAEPWTEAMRHDIEVRAGMDAVDIYGLSEVMGPGVASECIETKDGPVIWEDHFYPEIIDPETGEVLPDGEEGELVFTTLTKEALPVIRYRTRDLTRLLPPTARSMRRMGKIVGRSDDMLIIRGVNVFPTQIEELVLQHGQLSGQYQLVVTRSGALDELQVLVELLPEHAYAERDAVAGVLASRIKTLIGVSATISVGAPDSIERTLVGKARRVIDKRPR